MAPLAPAPDHADVSAEALCALIHKPPPGDVGDRGFVVDLVHPGTPDQPHSPIHHANLQTFPASSRNVARRTRRTSPMRNAVIAGLQHVGPFGLKTTGVRSASISAL